jgi:hypothetical protein
MGPLYSLKMNNAREINMTLRLTTLTVTLAVASLNHPAAVVIEEHAG